MLQPVPMSSAPIFPKISYLGLQHLLIRCISYYLPAEIRYNERKAIHSHNFYYCPYMYFCRLKVLGMWMVKASVIGMISHWDFLVSSLSLIFLIPVCVFILYTHKNMFINTQTNIVVFYMSIAEHVYWICRENWRWEQWVYCYWSV